MFSPDNRKASAILVFVIFGSYLVSGAFFAGVSFLLGALNLGFICKKDWLMTAVVLVLYLAVLLLDGRVWMSFGVYYPYLFPALVLLGMGIAPHMKKGDLLLAVTVIVAAAYMGFMYLMENKYGLVAQSLQQAREEVQTMGSVLKGIAAEGEIEEFKAFSLKLLDEYYVFFALVQIVVFCVVNFYLAGRLFPGLPAALAEPFGSLNVPYWGIWALNAGLAVYLLAPAPAAMLGANMALFFLSFYFFQGLALSTLFFKRYGVPPFVAVFFLVFFLLNQAMWIVMSVAGILDVQFNLKKYLKEA